VFGEGPMQARAIFVGEQPGDQEEVRLGDGSKGFQRFGGVRTVSAYRHQMKNKPPPASLANEG
jgi:hypothetical protein